jgi:O-antigen ligase
MTIFYPPQPRTTRAPVAATAPEVPSSSQPERVDALLVMTILFMLFSVVSINELLPFLLPLRLGLVSFILATLLYLSRPTGRRSIQRLLKDRTAKAFLVLFGWMVVTVPIVGAPGGAFWFILQKFSTIAVLFLLIVAVSRGIRDFRRFTLWYFLGVGFYAVEAIRHLDQLVGENDWRMSSVSNLYDANDFAVLCITGIPFAIHFARQRGPLWLRLASIGSLLVLTRGIVASGSRGGLIATCAMVLFILFWSSAIKPAWRIAGLLAVIIVFVATASDRYWTQMSSITNPSEDYNVTSEFGRKQLWKRGIGYGLQYPIAGVGANNFGWAEGILSEEVRRIQERGEGTPMNVPHNTYVQVFSELGPIGFILFLSLIIAAWKSLNRADRAAPDGDTRSLVQASKAATVGMLVGVFFLSFAYSAMLYTMLALATVAGRTVGAAGAESKRRDPAGQGPLYPRRTML